MLRVNHYVEFLSTNFRSEIKRMFGVVPRMYKGQVCFLFLCSLPRVRALVYPNCQYDSPLLFLISLLRQRDQADLQFAGNHFAHGPGIIQ